MQKFKTLSDFSGSVFFIKEHDYHVFYFKQISKLSLSITSKDEN